ncbi:MAG: hypothetical protein J6I86_01825 [Bacteroidaceae bacterium]|nr:hypothetical protein [Bacteroidaceae bacterium]
MKQEELCREVERQANFHPCARTDFDYLSEKILAKTNETLSPNTLMRLWGYRESVNARRATLDILSRFVGYEDYAHFIAARGLKEEDVAEEEEKKTLPEPKTLPDPPLKGGGQDEAEAIQTLSNSPLKGEENSSRSSLDNDDSPSRRIPITPKRIGIVLLLAFALGLAVWSCFAFRSPLEVGLPAGAKDMTHLLGNPTCEPDKLSAWTFERGGVTLAEDSTLMYYMKNFDVCQVVRGLPAGEYELRVNAWQLPEGQEAALYNYEHAKDKEGGCFGTNAEIYAGPFFKRVKNFCSEPEGKRDNALRFVVVDDSVRIGFRSDDNFRRFSLAVADNFRLFLIRKAKSDAELRELTAKRDSAMLADKAQHPQKEGIFLKTHNIMDAWKGHEAPLPEGWETEQDTSRCHLVHRSDVGRGFGDSDIYLEYFSNEPAKPGLLIGQKIFLQPGSYKVGACIFAQNAQGDETNVRFVVKGTEAFTGCPVLMDGWSVHFTLSEPREVTIGLWAPEDCNVRRAGICVPAIWEE